MNTLENLHAEWEYFYDNFLWNEAQSIEDTLERLGYFRDAITLAKKRFTKIASVQESLQ